MASTPMRPLAPIATTRRRGHLSFALGGARGTRPCGRQRLLQECLAGLRGTQELHCHATICLAQDIVLKPFPQRLAVFGAEGDLLKVVQQASFHHGLPPTLGHTCGRLDCAQDVWFSGSHLGCQARLSEGDGAFRSSLTKCIPAFASPLVEPRSILACRRIWLCMGKPWLVACPLAWCAARKRSCS